MSIWITYAWKDNEEGNFDYLVQELNNYGIIAKYDKVALIPGQKLWTQIADKINDPNTKGWAYLITPNSLKSNACLEELEYAIYRAVNSKNSSFPLIGLVAPGVSYAEVPTSLKVRLCINLSNPSWKEQIKAGINFHPAQKIDSNQTKYIYNISQKFNGEKLVTTIEIRPRFEEVHFWRIAVPFNSNIVGFGVGPANSGQITGMLEMALDGFEGDMNGSKVKLVGAGSRLTPGTSAYIYIDNGAPDFIAFGTANEPFGMPTQMEIQKIN